MQASSALPENTPEMDESINTADTAETKTSKNKSQPVKSEDIPRNWDTFNWGSAFSAFIYPGLGVLVLMLAVGLAIGFTSIELQLWYLPVMALSGVACILLCNFGIGSLHRIWQHRGGEMAAPAETFVALNCILAMQGPLKDWINYHHEHHRFADRPGDPHNPHESKFWAWVGWVLWRDPADLAKPLPKFMSNNAVISWADRNHSPLSLIVHLIIPAAAYLLTFLLGGPVVLVALIHSVVVIARGLHFHATTLGINVCGHLNVPAWMTWTLALATGGEAFHDHHHSQPRSVLHLPRKGIINRLVDYNGTFLLFLRKLGMLRDERIAEQFA